MPFNFGVIFAIACLIGGLLMMVCWQPFWWLMKKKGNALSLQVVSAYSRYPSHAVGHWNYRYFSG